MIYLNKPICSIQDSNSVKSSPQAYLSVKFNSYPKIAYISISE